MICDATGITVYCYFLRRIASRKAFLVHFSRTTMIKKTSRRKTVLILVLFSSSDAWTNHREKAKPDIFSRRESWTKTAGAIAAATMIGPLFIPMPPADAATSLAAKLAARDPNALGNSVFNVPPVAQVYPEFMRGTWDVQIQFAGFLFPSKKIPKERITQNALIPGFQKCSIAAICDVGKDSSYTMVIDPTTGLEDRVLTLTSQIRGFLGYDAVREILYNPKSNPNRLSIDFVEYQTKNAERIELFVNARESESVPETGVFVCSEYLRQVTFGTGSEVGIPRQVVGNYAHFWTWRPAEEDGRTLKGNLLTAAYLDPQDAMFFDEPSKPVAVYSHMLKATKEQ